MAFLRKLIQMSLWQQIAVALVLGIIVGIWLPELSPILAPLGQLFINAIQLMVVPVVFVSITCGVLSLRGTASMGRIAAKTIITYIFTMATATAIGIGVAEIIQPGQGLDLAELENQTVHIDVPEPTMNTVITTLIPSNMFHAFTDNSQILQVIIIAIIMASAIIMAGDSGRRLSDMFDSAFAVMMKFAQLIMRFAPLGVFCLIGVMIGQFGSRMLYELFALVITVYIGCILNAVIVYSSLLSFVSRLNPLPFFRGIADALVFAFSTSSSSATLPITMRCSQQNHGVAKNISEFVMPLGATINMNGLAVYLGAAAIFASNLYGIDLSFWQFVLIIVTSTVAAIGAAGVPGSALFVMALVMSSVGIPLTVIGIIAAVDRIIDMMTTTINVTGDAATAVIVAASEDALNKKRYYGKPKK